MFNTKHSFWLIKIWWLYAFNTQTRSLRRMREHKYMHSLIHTCTSNCPTFTNIHTYIHSRTKNCNCFQSISLFITGVNIPEINISSRQIIITVVPKFDSLLPVCTPIAQIWDETPQSPSSNMIPVPWNVFPFDLR